MIPGNWSAGRRRIAAGAVALAGALGLGLAWWLHDPWPARVVIRPPDGGWPQGFDRDGRSYQTSGTRGVAHWDAATGREVALGPLPVVWRRSWTEDGRCFAGMVVGPGGQAVVWGDAATDEVKAEFPVPGRNVMGPRLVDGGRAVRAVLLDPNRVREVATWYVATGVESRRTITGPAHLLGIGRAVPIGYSPDGGTWAYLDPTRGGILLWDAELDRPRGPILRDPSAPPPDEAVVDFSPDGRTLAVGRDHGRVEFWDVPAARLLRTVAAHPADHAPGELEFSPDGRTLTSAAHEPGTGWSGWTRDEFNKRVPQDWRFSYRREVVVLDVATGATLARSPGSIHPQFSPDGRTLATHEADGSFSLRAVPPRP